MGMTVAEEPVQTTVSILEAGSVIPGSVSVQGKGFLSAMEDVVGLMELVGSVRTIVPLGITVTQGLAYVRMMFVRFQTIAFMENAVSVKNASGQTVANWNAVPTQYAVRNAVHAPQVSPA